MNISSSAPQASIIHARPPSSGEQTPRLNESDLKLLTQMKARDREVRAHEAAHQAVGGQHAGSMSLTYEQGPDGVAYAVSGEVPISISAVAADPQATIEKMRTVRAAAMAPAQPSAADLAVAAQAMQILLQAQVEVTELSSAESLGARQARETYATVAAFGDDENAETSLTIAV